jgi:hypothetical protein
VRVALDFSLFSQAATATTASVIRMAWLERLVRWFMAST